MNQRRGFYRSGPNRRRKRRTGAGGCVPAPVWFPYRAFFEGGLSVRSPVRPTNPGVRAPMFLQPGSHPDRGHGAQKETPSAGTEGVKNGPAAPAARPKLGTFPVPAEIPPSPSVSDLPSPRRDHSDRLAGHLTPFRAAGGPAEGQRMMYFSSPSIPGGAGNVKREFSFFSPYPGIRAGERRPPARCSPYSPGSMRMTLPMFQV